MERPDQYSDLERSKHTIAEIMLFDSRISNLMFEIGSRLSAKVVSIQIMRDDDFVHRRDRTSNDIHMFCELKNGQYFHLRVYTRHMLDMDEIPTNTIFLTGYIKELRSQIGGNHSLKQNWYEWDADIIADQIITQNPLFFY